MLLTSLDMLTNYKQKAQMKDNFYLCDYKIDIWNYKSYQYFIQRKIADLNA